MPYGTIKVDNITFTDNSVDKTVSLSGLIQNPTFTGNVTVTGTISGDVIRGGTTISGVTVTGTTANFVSGVFTTQISGATITGTTVATTTGSFVSLTGTTATFTSGIIASGTAALPSLAILSDPNTGIYSPGADQLAISTNGTGRITVDASGNVNIDSNTLYVDAVNNRVGVGTTGPANALLHVSSPVSAGAIKSEDTNSTGSFLRILGDAGSGNLVNWKTGTVLRFAISDDNYGSFSEKARIDSSGNMGIGVVPSAWGSPQKAIEFSGGSSLSFNTGAPQWYLNSNCYYNGTNWIYKTTAVANQFLGNAAGGGFIWNNAASGTAGNAITFSEAMRLDASGNLGIGAAPTYQLDLNRSGSPVFRVTNGTTACYMQPESGSACARIGSLSNHPVAFAINGSEVSRFDTSGRLGIGTTSPSQALHVVSNSTQALFEGATQGNINIQKVGTNGFGIYSDAAGTLSFYDNSASTLRARIDNSGRLLVGTSSARNNLYAGGSPRLQVEGVSDTDQWASLISSQNSITGPNLILGHQRSGTIGGNTILQNNDEVGTLVFQGNDGANFISSASIRSFVDGTPGTTDMPGRLMFSTTADGAASPTEALRITNDRVLAYNQPTPATYAAAATLTVADLKTGIITYTGAVATLTLPTGTLTEGGFSGIYTNMTFEWSVINTGAGICTIGAGTAHTIVGSATVAIGASARFASRRTAANTFVSYRLS